MSVRGQQTSTAGRPARWALLVCTLLGLAAMHSLGHHGDAHPSMILAEGHHASVMVGAADSRAAPCADGGCVFLGAAPGGGNDTPAWSVCLAVLGGLAVVALLGALLPASRRANPAGIVLAGSGLDSRAPPGLWPLGLTLATVSVLRR